jgi:pyrroline-5-carboxylate reductase
MYSFGFIGTGNMGAALAGAAVKSVEPEKIILANRTPEKAQLLADRLGCAWGTNEQAAKAKFIMLGVKPQMMEQMLSGISSVLKGRDDRYILVTMAASLTMDTITQMAGVDCPVIRIMPNTPASVGQGVILCCANDKVTQQEMDEFAAAFAGAGIIDNIDETMIDAASALSGCGPAFVYMFIEALADGAVECGLPREKAQKYAAQTLLGASKLVLDSGAHPGALKDAVCSPGGTTIAGVHALEKGGFRGLAMDAVKSAYDKTIAMKKK